MRISWILASFATVAVLAGCGGGAKTASPPTGTYEANVRNAGSFTGQWAIEFGSDGTDTVKLNGAVFVTEKASFSGSSVTFNSDTGPHACPLPGKYSWELSGQHLHFTRISDTCQGRMVTLSHPFAKKV